MLLSLNLSFKTGVYLKLKSIDQIKDQIICMTTTRLFNKSNYQYHNEIYLTNCPIMNYVHVHYRSMGVLWSEWHRENGYRTIAQKFQKCNWTIVKPALISFYKVSTGIVCWNHHPKSGVVEPFVLHSHSPPPIAFRGKWLYKAIAHSHSPPLP